MVKTNINIQLVLLLRFEIICIRFSVDFYTLDAQCALHTQAFLPAQICSKRLALSRPLSPYDTIAFPSIGHSNLNMQMLMVLFHLYRENNPMCLKMYYWEWNFIKLTRTSAVEIEWYVGTFADIIFFFLVFQINISNVLFV